MAAAGGSSRVISQRSGLAEEEQPTCWQNFTAKYDHWAQKTVCGRATTDTSSALLNFVCA